MSSKGGEWSQEIPVAVRQLMEVPGVREQWVRECREGRTTLPLDIWSCDAYLAHSLDLPTSPQMIESPEPEPGHVPMTDSNPDLRHQMESQADNAPTSVADDSLSGEHAPVNPPRVMRRTQRRISRTRCQFCR